MLEVLILLMAPLLILMMVAVHAYASGPADDAAGAVAYALRCRLTGLSQEAVWAARRAYDAADTVASARYDDAGMNAPGIEDSIAADDLIQQELGRQEDDLRSLEP